MLIDNSTRSPLTISYSISSGRAGAGATGGSTVALPFFITTLQSPGLSIRNRPALPVHVTTFAPSLRTVGPFEQRFDIGPEFAEGHLFRFGQHCQVIRVADAGPRAIMASSCIRHVGG